MSEEKVGFEVQGKSTFDPSGTNAAAEGLKKVKGAGDEAKEGLADFGKQIRETFMEFFTVAKGFEQLKEGLEEFMNLEQSYRELSRAAEKYGQDQAKVKEELEGFAKRLGEVAGIADEESIPALVKLYSATGNVETAQKRAALAADIAIARNIPFADALNVVTQAAGGNIRVLREVGIFMQSTGDKTKDADLSLKLLVGGFAGAADKAGGLKVEMARLNVTYDEMRGEVIEKLVPVLDTLGKVGLTVFLALQWGADKVGQVVLHVVNGVKGAVNILSHLLVGDLQGAQREFRNTMEEINGVNQSYAASEEKLALKFEKVWSAANAEQKKLGIDRNQEHSKIVAEEAKRESQLAEIKLKILQEEGRHREALDLEEQIALSKITGKTKDAEEERQAIRELYAQKRENLERKLDAEQLAAMTKAVQRMEKIQKEFRDKAEAEADKAAADEKKRITAQLAFDEKMSKEKLKVISSIDAKLEAEKEAIDAKRKAALDKLESEGIKTAENVAKVQQQAARETLKVELEAIKSKVMAWTGALQFTTESLTTLFGDNKALAIAQAVINTAQAVVMRLGDPFPLNYINPALAAAAGIAQIAKIEGTSYSASGDTGKSLGFDNPQHDAMAYRAGYLGGQRWAQDMVNLTTGGLMAGWSDTLRGARIGGGVTNQTTIDNRRTNNISVHAGVLDSSDVPGLKRLYRQLQLVAKLDDQRKL